jgi:hypothetical protein
MRLSRLFGALGAAVLLGAAITPAALAAPTDQHQPTWGQTERRWHRYWGHDWDQSQPWYQRTVVLRPNPTVGQPLPVQVVAPQPTLQSFGAPAFATALQQYALPALVQMVPVEYLLQAPPSFVQVQPHLYVVAHPQLFWGPDQSWAAHQYANWLAASYPSFQPYAFHGPQGYGTYLAFDGRTSGHFRY